MRAGQIFELADKGNFYCGREVEVISIQPGSDTAWVKLANYSPGSIEFNANLACLKTPTPPMTVDRVKATGRQFGQKISTKEAKAIAAVLKGAK